MRGFSESREKRRDRTFDRITPIIIHEALRIHRSIGPGLLETTYTHLLARALANRGLKVVREGVISAVIDGIVYDGVLRPDIVVENQVVVEVKSVEKLAPVFSKQVLTYLRVMGLRVGLLLNFGGETLAEGIRRIVNDYEDPPESRKNE